MKFIELYVSELAWTVSSYDEEDDWRSCRPSTWNCKAWWVGTNQIHGKKCTISRQNF